MVTVTPQPWYPLTGKVNRPLILAEPSVENTSPFQDIKLRLLWPSILYPGHHTDIPVPAILKKKVSYSTNIQTQTDASTALRTDIKRWLFPWLHKYPVNLLCIITWRVATSHFCDGSTSRVCSSLPEDLRCLHKTAIRILVITPYFHNMQRINACFGDFFCPSLYSLPEITNFY